MKFPESLEASGLAEAGPADHARNAFATPKNCPVCQLALGMTIRINTDVIRNTSKEKFFT